MTPEHAQNLICPLCQKPLMLNGGQLNCENRHGFDVARQGYVNLLPVQHKKSKSPGDSKAMVQARKSFLQAGFYEPIANALSKSVCELAMVSPINCILDAGSGEGYYLDYLLTAMAKTMPESAADRVSYGVDISKDAVVEAAKRNKLVTWIVGSNARLPVQDHSLDLILCLFGFPCYEEFVGKLNAGGHILIVDAGPEHLIELRNVIYPEVQKSPPPQHTELLALSCKEVSQQSLQFKIELDTAAMIHHLLVMTPHMYKASQAGRDAAESLESIALTVDIVLRVFERFG